MTDKGSQDENGREAEGHLVTGDPRSAGGPATGGSRADPRTEPPRYRDPDLETTDTDGQAQPSLASPFDEPTGASEPEHAEIVPLTDGSPTEAPHASPASDPPPTGFTSAAYDLFFPQPADTPPTYQTRGSASYGGVRAPQPDAETAKPPAIGWEHRKARAVELFWIGARYAGYAAAGYLALVLVLILLFRFVNPPASSLMLGQWLTGNSVNRTWVPIGRISPNLIRAVIVAEDGRFCDHAGIDFQAIGEAIRNAADGTPRGASTISMQVTKNMFLWSSRSYIRKIVELPLTLIMELVWPKWRVLEVYLNIAELGPGVYGAEAASRYHFHQSAARLSERQAALLAASLPNPIVRDAGDPSTLVSRKARVIQARMRAAGSGAAACVLSRI